MQIFAVGARLFGAGAHSAECPVEIHRSRPRSTEQPTSFSDALEQVLSRCPAVPLPQRHNYSHCCRDADQRRTSDPERANRFRHMVH
jgi:hypothetical protein